MGDRDELRLAPVLLLDPERATFRDMLDGWARSQQARGLSRSTIASQLWSVQRFHAVVDEYPWAWRPTDVEDYTATLLSRRPPLAHSTIRGYHQSIKSFCAFLTEPSYGWGELCQDRFGQVPVQICHPWNTHRHLAEFEARPSRRGFTYDELEAFFEVADAHVDRARRGHKKGQLAALRDAQFFKTVYAFGLRRGEGVMLDLADLRANPAAPQWGQYGRLHVRYGKALKGSPPRRRTVLALPEFDWALEGLRHWIEQVRPHFSEALSNPAVWINERGTRVNYRSINVRFAAIRDELGLSGALTLHSLRHSYVTHLIEHGYPERFVQEQVGHSYASTTAIYTSVSDDFKNRILAEALTRAYGDLQRGQP